MDSSRTDDRPIGFGRKGERVAKTPIRTFPPNRGGLTVGDQCLLGLCPKPCRSTKPTRAGDSLVAENPQMSQM